MDNQKKLVIEHAIIFTIFGVGIGLGLQNLYQLTGAEFSKVQLGIILSVSGVIATATGIFGKSISTQLIQGDTDAE